MSPNATMRLVTKNTQMSRSDLSSHTMPNNFATVASDSSATAQMKAASRAGERQECK